MKYYSLKNKLHKVNFKEALFNGLAPDRGLYFPKEVTELNNSFISGRGDSNENFSTSLICFFIFANYFLELFIFVFINHIEPV